MNSMILKMLQLIRVSLSVTLQTWLDLLHYGPSAGGVSHGPKAFSVELGYRQ